MKRIGSRASDGVDHSARCSSILGRVARSNDGKLLDSFGSQSRPEHVSRTAVAIIVYADAVDTIVVLRGTASGDSELRAETPIAPGGSRSTAYTRLQRTERGHARLQSRKLRPVAAVQRQLANRDCADFIA